MSSSDKMPLSGSSRTPRVLACVLCQQRKVKCDRRFPCAHCVKARVQCVSATPAPPRRRRKRVPNGEDELLQKVKKYETMLQTYGEKLDLVNTEGKDEKLPGGNATLSEDEQLDHQTDSDSGFPDIASLLLDSCAPDADLTSMHPSPMHIFRLWQTFLDNVNPIVKISHAPTIQQKVLEASANLASISKPMEALLFALYSVAVNSLTNAECDSMLGTQKIEALAKYHAATLRALQRVHFLRTDDMIVLQAFVLFLISARTYYDTRTQWVLSGVSNVALFASASINSNESTFPGCCENCTGNGTSSRSRRKRHLIFAI